MLTGILLIFVFVGMLIGMYLLYSRYLALVKTLSSFKPTEIHIGKIPEFTQNHEDILSHNKEALEAIIAYLEKKLDMANASMHDRSITNEQVQFIRGQCDTYITVRGQMKTLLARKNKNDK